MARIRQMSRQVSRGSAVEYQEDEQAGSYVVGTNYRVLIYCTCHFQGSSLGFSFCLLVSSVSDFRPREVGPWTKKSRIQKSWLRTSSP